MEWNWQKAPKLASLRLEEVGRVYLFRVEAFGEIKHAVLKFVGRGEKNSYEIVRLPTDDKTQFSHPVYYLLDPVITVGTEMPLLHHSPFDNLGSRVTGLIREIRDVTDYAKLPQLALSF